jgi:soluble lytic murein transglycosylase
LPVYRVWAEREARGMLGLGWCLYTLERYAEALKYLERVESQESRYVRGLALEKLGRLGEAIGAYRYSSFSGRWRGAGLLERSGQTWLALTQYLQLAEEQTLYADDARYRAWVLAGRLGDEERRERIRAQLQGGLAVLAGKPLRLTLTETIPEEPTRPVSEAYLLRQAGKHEWARGVLRLAMLNARDPRERLLLAQNLGLAGAYREALKVTDGLIAGGMPASRKLLEAAYPRAYRQWVEQYAQIYDLEPTLLYAVMRVESRFDPNALSITGAKGLTQFIPSTWQTVAEQLGEAAGNPFDPETAIRYGAHYLRWLFGQCRDTANPKVCAISSYNGGIGYFLRGLKAAGNLDDFLRFQERDEPREYLERVLEAEAYYKFLYP